MSTTTDLLDLRDIGQRGESARFELLTPTLAYVADLHPDRGSVVTVSNDCDAGIKRTASGLRLVGDDVDLVDPDYHRVRISLTLHDGSEHHEGVFLFGKYDEYISTRGNFVSTALLDQGLMLDQAMRSSYGLAPAALVSDALKFLATDARVPSFEIEDSARTIGPAPVAWDKGTSRLEIMTHLCKLAGFLPPYFDNDGTLRCRAGDVSPGAATIRYTPGPTSRIYVDTPVTSFDPWRVASHYVRTNTSTTDNEISGEFVVPSDSPFSEDQRGFKVVDFGDAAGADDTDACVAAAQADYIADLNSPEPLEFDGAPDPRHDTFDIVEFDGTLYRETSWSLALAPGGPHHHVLTRLYG